MVNVKEITCCSAEMINQIFNYSVSICHYIIDLLTHYSIIRFKCCKLWWDGWRHLETKVCEKWLFSYYSILATYIRNSFQALIYYFRKISALIHAYKNWSLWSQYSNSKIRFSTNFLCIKCHLLLSNCKIKNYTLYIIVILWLMG